MLDEGYHELPLLAACVASGSGLCWPCCEELVLSVGTQEISAISVMRCCWQQVPALSPRLPRRGRGFLPKEVPSASRLLPHGILPAGSPARKAQHDKWGSALQAGAATARPGDTAPVQIPVWHLNSQRLEHKSVWQLLLRLFLQHGLTSILSCPHISVLQWREVRGKYKRLMWTPKQKIVLFATSLRQTKTFGTLLAHRLLSSTVCVLLFKTKTETESA